MRKRTKICGTKPSTAPTPATIPSKIRLVSQGAQFIEAKPFPSATGIPGTNLPKKLKPSPKSPSFVKSVNQVPTVVTEIN